MLLSNGMVKEEQEQDVSCFGTVFVSDKIIRWDPYNKFKIEKNVEGYPVIHQVEEELEEEFDVEINGQQLKCKKSSDEKKLLVSVADVRYNCCPVYLWDTNLVVGIYFCGNIRSSGYCYVNIHEFINNDIYRITQLPLSCLIEFTKDYIFVDFLSKTNRAYQCVKTKKFVEKKHSLFSTFRMIGTRQIQFYYIDEETPTTIEVASDEELQDRLRIYPHQNIHDQLPCIICDFYVDEKKTNLEEIQEDTCVLNEQKEHVSYFPSNRKLTFRKKINTQILSQYN